MSLRSRQIVNLPLSKGAGFFLSLFGTVVVYVIAVRFWIPLFETFLFFLPKGIKVFFPLIGSCIYLGSCVERVPANIERAQLFFGSYTGISFSSGVYMLPKLPFPVVSLFLKKLVSEDAFRYFGWSLSGDASIASISIPVDVRGMTQDGVRVVLRSTMLVFEVYHLPSYLAQTKGSEDTASLRAILSQRTAMYIKEYLIAKMTVQDLQSSSFGGTESVLAKWISETCQFTHEYGVYLAHVPVVEVEILNKQLEAAFDHVEGKGLLQEHSNEIANAFLLYYKKMPEGVTPDLALVSFNNLRLGQGLPPVTMNMVQLK